MIYKGKPIVFQVRTAVAFSPDGKVLATIADGVVLRDAQSGDVITTLKHPGKGVRALAFSPDSKALVTAAADMKVRVWSVPEGALTKTLSGPTQPPSAVAISPDGSRMVAVSNGSRSLLSRNKTPIGYLWSWDREGGSAQKLEIANAEVHQVGFLGSTTVAVAAGSDVLAVDLSEAEPRTRKLHSHSEEVLALSISPDHRLVASGGKDRTVDVVEVATGKLVHRLPGLNDIVSSAATSGDGQRFAIATIDRRFSNRPADEETSFAARYQRYFSPAANADRLQPSELRLWSTHDGRMAKMLPLPSCQVTATRFLFGGEQLAVAGWIPDQGGMLSLWDANSGQHVRNFAVAGSEVLSIAVSPDGRTLASGDAQGNLQLWDAQSAAKGKSYKHGQPVKAITFSKDGKRLATADAERTVRLFDPASGAVVRTLKSRSHIESLDFSPDANLLAAGTREPGFELWDLKAGTASRALKASGDYFANMPGYVAFSPDGQYVVCGGHGKDIAVFDVASGNLKCELRGHAHAPTAAAFLPDGRLISGGEERTVRLWDLNLAKCLATWIVMPANRAQQWNDEWVGFKPSGQFVGSSSLDRLIGWQSGGEVIDAPERANGPRRVENLFQADAAPASVDK